MIVLMVIVASVLYFMTMGYGYSRFLSYNKGRCQSCSRGSRYCSMDHETAAFFLAAFWPVGIPFMVAAHLGNTEARGENKRAREIDEAEHKLRLAKIKRQEEEETTRRLRAME